jgi:NAD(P)-dependent dehydrogenase (short-subunit alcohol dehydrogenase family)
MASFKTPWNTAWITGASTGIGRSIALKLAAANVKVAASARTQENLTDLASCHPNITPAALDVGDRDAVLASAVPRGEQIGEIDIAILNAGIWHPSWAKEIDGAKAADSMAVNYLGVVNCIEALLPHMTRRGRGHIAITSSVAGYRGLPKSCHYGPTKAAIYNLAETLSIELKSEGIDITVISPGFVETPMTSVNDFPMPYIMSSDEAADRILKKLPSKPFEIAFPWQLVWSLKLAQVLPTPLYLWQARRSLGGIRKK